MSVYKRAAALTVGILTAVLMSQTPAVAEVTELNILASEKNFPRVSRSYASMDARFSRPGTPKTAAEVRRVAIGSTQIELVRAIGQPVSAYKDGSWNFDIALPLPQRNRLICQYRVFFDDDNRVSGTIWRRPQCVDLVTRN